MSLPRKFLLGGVFWLSLVTFLHLWLNLGVFKEGMDLGEGEKRFRIGFLPVT